jgi:hypothetical protein
MRETLIYLKNELCRLFKNPQKSVMLISGLVVLTILFLLGIYGLFNAGNNQKAKNRMIDPGSPHLVISSRIELMNAVYNTHQITDRLKRYNFRGAIKLKGTNNHFEFQPGGDRYGIVFTVDGTFDVQVNTGEDNRITYKKDGITITIPPASALTVKQSESKNGTSVQIRDLTGKINIDILHNNGANLEIMRSF